MFKSSHFIVAISMPVFIFGCATTKSISTVTDSSYSDIRNNTRYESTSYSSSNPEIQCLGDLQATYETWDIEPNKPQNIKYNLTILPITNQTPVSNEIPQDMSLLAQNIASKLGIGYNVIFTPSTSDINYAPNSLFTEKYSSLLIERAGNSANNILGDVRTNISNKNITVIAALTEYQVAKQDSDSVNATTTGTTSGKSFSAGASLGQDKYQGKISMVFNTAYFARTGDYSTPQLIYNPNTSTEVTIDFEELKNSDEFSFSYNGGEPVIGSKATFSTEDSRFAAINLLIERGLLETLGKYHRVPYWRCMIENQIGEEVTDPETGLEFKTVALGKTPLTLKDAREVQGYNSDVEHMVRRMFRYKGSPSGLGPYQTRLKHLDSASDEVILVAKRIKTPNNPWDFKKDGNVYALSVMKGTYDNFDLGQCLSMPEVQNINNSLNLLNARMNAAESSGDQSTLVTLRSQANQLTQESNSFINACKGNKHNEFIQFLSSEDIDIDKDKELVLVGKSEYTGQSLFNMLRLVSESNTNSEHLAGDKELYTSYLNSLNTAVDGSAISTENAFVNLWMSAPYLEESRIYPYYINNDFNHSPLGAK